MKKRKVVGFAGCGMRENVRKNDILRELDFILLVHKFHIFCADVTLGQQKKRELQRINNQAQLVQMLSDMV